MYDQVNQKLSIWAALLQVPSSQLIPLYPIPFLEMKHPNLEWNHDSNPQTQKDDKKVKTSWFETSPYSGSSIALNSQSRSNRLPTHQTLLILVCV